MNKEKAQALLMDYLYNEMSKDEKEEFELYLNKHPDLQRELDEMKETRSMLQQMPIENPASRTLVIDPGSSRFLSWWQDAKKVLIPKSTPGKTVFAMAAVLLISVLLASAASLRIHTTETGLTIAFGSAVTEVQQRDTGLSEDDVAVLLSQIQQENAILAASLVEQAQQQQAEQFEEVLATVVRYFEEQRLNDLRLVGSGIAQLEEETYFRFRQTDEALSDLIYAINIQQE